MSVIQARILTVSDRCSRGEATDTAGPAVASQLRQTMRASIESVVCVPDEHQEIARTLRTWAAEEPALDLILTVGGTGLAPRDVTPEATRAVLDRPHPGIVELMRARCGERHPRAYLSRAVAGTIGQTLVVNLPGSERAAVESLDAIMDILPHALGVLSGRDRDCGAQPATRGGAP